MSKKKNKRNKKKAVSLTGRNWLAVSAQFASGAGRHGDSRYRRLRTRNSRKKAAMKEYGY